MPLCSGHECGVFAAHTAVAGSLMTRDDIEGTREGEARTALKVPSAVLSR